MNEQTTGIILSASDVYVFARVLVRLDWQDLPCSPVTRLVLSNIDVTQPDGLQLVRHLLGPDVLRALVPINPFEPRRTTNGGRARGGQRRARPACCRAVDRRSAPAGGGGRALVG